MSLIELFDFVWDTIHCTKFSENSAIYRGTDVNDINDVNDVSSDILRFTTLAYSDDLVYDCELDIDLLESFSKYLNLRLVYQKPEKNHAKKLGYKSGDTWVNGTLADLNNNKLDYLCDYAHLQPSYIGDMKYTTPVCEIYELALAMRKLPKPRSFARFLEQFEWQVWLGVCLMLVAVIIYGTLYRCVTRKSHLMSCLMDSFTYFYSVNILSDAGVTLCSRFGRAIVILWIYYSLIICESFKSVLLSNLVRQPVYGFDSIKELANAPKHYHIFIPFGSPTFNRLVERANNEGEDAVHFKKVLERVECKSWDDMHSLDTISEYGDGSVALLFTSLKFEAFNQLDYAEELANTLLQFDKIHDIRLIRNNYQYSDRMVKIAALTMEAGLDRHWYSLKQTTLPLMIRQLAPEYISGRDMRIKSFEFSDLDGIFYLILLVNHFYFVIFIVECVSCRRLSYCFQKSK